MISRIFAVLIVFFTFISCNSDEDNLQKELNGNRQLWESSQIENYKLNERVSCFCGGPLEWDVFVLNEVKNSVVFDESSVPLENLEEIRASIFNNARTIEDAFNFAEELLNRDVASLIIEYDEMYGFPKAISIDYNEVVADDEITYIYSNFEITN